jgi:hypothetical protein
MLAQERPVTALTSSLGSQIIRQRTGEPGFDSI